MPTIAIIQARMNSSRLPGKVLRPILGKPMLTHIVERVRQARGVDRVVVATSDRVVDEAIRDVCRQYGIDCFTGDEHDVLDRFYKAATHYDGDPVIRLTADCPLADPGVISALVATYHRGHYDHVGVATGAGAIFLDGGRYPDGYDAECIRFDALHKAWTEATAPTDREHVTPFIWRQPELFCLGALKSTTDYSTLRLTVDNEEDFRLIEAIYEALYDPARPFLLEDVVGWLDEHRHLLKLNEHLIGQEGYAELWQPAAA